MTGTALLFARRAIALSALAIMTAATADAKGIIRVQEVKSTLQTYPDVVIRAIKGTSLTVTSADGKGTLLFNNGACSFIGEVRRCYLYRATLNQGGASRPLDLDRGTLYINFTAVTQPLPQTSQLLAPNGVLIAMRTKIGTIITLTGTLDSVANR
jgi:hypothetical protein